MIEDCLHLPVNLTLDFKLGIRWFERISESERWNLTEVEKLRLLGDISPIAYGELLAGNENNISLDERNNIAIRLSVLLTIYKLSYALVGNEYFYLLFNKANKNSIFGGKSIKEILLAGNSLEQFFIVRKYLIDVTYY